MSIFPSFSLARHHAFINVSHPETDGADAVRLYVFVWKATSGLNREHRRAMETYWCT